MNEMAGVVALLTLGLALQALGEPPIAIGGRLELMVDDYLIEALRGGAQVRLHPPVRREVAMVTDAPWEGNACHYRSVFQDGELYRMYYSAIQYVTGGEESKALPSHPWFMAYAESKDGIHWTKPELGIAEFNGSKANNIVVSAASVVGASVDPAHCAVFKDANPACPPDAKYKALLVGSKPHGLYALKSADGLHFSLLSDKPILTKGAFDSQNLAFWDSVRQEYREYHRSFTDGVRAIMTATTKDFLKWPDPVYLEYPGAAKEHLYTNQILPYHCAPHIFLGFPMRYTDRGGSEPMFALPQLEERLVRAGHSRRYGTAVTDGLFMTSRDGVTFKRWPEAFIRPGPRTKGTWVYGDNSTAWGIVETKSHLADAPNELSIYATEGYWRGTSLNVRRYTLRMDGFVSVQAPASGGEVVPKPLTFEGGNLTMNFETSAAGSVRVEVQDADGTVRCYDGTSDRRIPGLEIKTDAWQDVVIRARMADAKFDLTVEDQTATDLPFGDPKVHRIQTIAFIPNAGNCTLYVASVKVKVIP